MAWTKQSNITPLLLLCTLVHALRRSVATRERPVPNIHPSANHGLLSLCLNRRRQGKSRQKNQFMRARAEQPFSLTRKDRLRATVLVFTRVVPQGIEMRESHSVTAVARCCQNSLPHPSEPKYLSTTSLCCCEISTWLFVSPFLPCCNSVCTAVCRASGTCLDLFVSFPSAPPSITRSITRPRHDYALAKLGRIRVAPICRLH
jgi:hypothetical protein